MQDTVGVFVGNLGQHVHLFRCQSSAWHFNAHHTGCMPEGIGSFDPVQIFEFELAAFKAVVPLAVIVALAVDASTQTRFGEDLFVQLALAHKLHLAFEDIDFVGQIIGHFIRQDVFPTDVRHSCLLACCLLRRQYAGLDEAGSPVQRSAPFLSCPAGGSLCWPANQNDRACGLSRLILVLGRSLRQL